MMLLTKLTVVTVNGTTAACMAATLKVNHPTHPLAPAQIDSPTNEVVPAHLWVWPYNIPQHESC